MHEIIIIIITSCNTFLHNLVVKHVGRFKLHKVQLIVMKIIEIILIEYGFPVINNARKSGSKREQHTTTNNIIIKIYIHSGYYIVR